VTIAEIASEPMQPRRFEKKTNTGPPYPRSTGRLRVAPVAFAGLMDVPRSVALFAVAAVAEIGGAWLVWQAVREGRPWHWAALGGLALVAYGFVATGQPDGNFGRVLAAYGGVFVAGSLVWGMVFDGFRPDRWDVIGAAICLVGVAVIMYVPR
jgi:small multidrug resistance family-3 protein